MKTLKVRKIHQRGNVRPAVLIATALAVAAVVAVVIISTKQKPATAKQDNSQNSTARDESRAPAAADTANISSSSQSSASQNPQNKPAETQVSAPPSAAASSIGDLVKRLSDGTLPLKERKKAISELAKNGSPEALAALKELLRSGPEDVRAAIAEGLGECGSPECTATLLGLLNDPSEAVVQGAIRGLAQQGSPQAVDALTKMLYDPSRSELLRGEAAAGLGTINQPGVVDTLAQAANTITDPDIVTHVLNALGGRDFSETQTFFQNYLHSANVSSELRVVAAESLAQAQGDPSAFLVSLASDVDADVRASAAWAMSATPENGTAATQILALLQGEQDPDVRLRLFQALRNQDNVDLASALAAVQRETDPGARVAGLSTLAKTLQRDPDPQVQAFFDQTGAPELRQVALTGDDEHDRMAAVIALTRAMTTPSAQNALVDIAQSSDNPKVKQAAASIVAHLQRSAQN